MRLLQTRAACWARQVAARPERLGRSGARTLADGPPKDSEEYAFMKNESSRVFTDPFNAGAATTAYPRVPPPKYTPPADAAAAGPEPLIPDPPSDFPQTGFDVRGPLRWPVDDRSARSMQETGLPSPPAFKEVLFDDPAVAPIGDYPRNVPRLWHALRSPTGHFDAANRREYGEVLPDDANFMGPLGPGVMVDWVPPFKSLLKLAGFFLGLGVACDYYDRNLSDNPVPKQYPFDGLRLEMGCDPADPSDFQRAKPRWVMPEFVTE